MATQPATRSWLDELQAQLKDVKMDGCEPDEPVGEGEKEMGILPPEDRPLWTLGEQLTHKMCALAKSGEHNRRSKDGCAACTEIARLQNITNTLSEMFWTACRTRFNIWDTSVGIRKGWKVVKMEKDDQPQRRSLISILFGG